MQAKLEGADSVTPSFTEPLKVQFRTKYWFGLMQG